jgi:hypothetical protein
MPSSRALTIALRFAHDPVAAASPQGPSRGQRFSGDRKCLLGDLLGDIEVAEEADQGGEEAAPLVAEDLLKEKAPGMQVGAARLEVETTRSALAVPAGKSGPVAGARGVQ